MSGDRISTFNEKMENPPTNVINAGCYIFNRSVIDEIPAGKVVSVERETFPGLLNRGANVMGFVDDGYWLDIGNPGALLKATRDLIEVTGYPFMQAMGSTIDPTAVIDGGSYIGLGAKVAAGAKIHQSVIGDGAIIGENVDLTRVFVSAGTEIAAKTTAESEFFGYSQQ